MTGGVIGGRRPVRVPPAAREPEGAGKVQLNVRVPPAVRDELAERARAMGGGRAATLGSALADMMGARDDGPVPAVSFRFPHGFPYPLTTAMAGDLAREYGNEPGRLLERLSNVPDWSLEVVEATFGHSVRARMGGSDVAIAWCEPGEQAPPGVLHFEPVALVTPASTAFSIAFGDGGALPGPADWFDGSAEGRDELRRAVGRAALSALVRCAGWKAKTAEEGVKWENENHGNPAC